MIKKLDSKKYAQKTLGGARLVILIATCLVLSACINTLDSSAQKVDPKKQLDTHVQLGLTYLQRNNRDLARSHLLKALELNKNYAPMHNGLAILYLREGEAELAEEHYKTAIKEDSAFSMARNNYGTFLYDRGRFQEAYKQFEIAGNDLSYDRRDMALYNLGRTGMKLHNEEKAEGALTHALNINPRLNLAMLELAEIKLNKEQYPEAKRYLDMFASASRHTPRSLLMGISIERTFGNKDQEASYILQLKNLHPYSREYLEYKQSVE